MYSLNFSTLKYIFYAGHGPARAGCGLMRVRLWWAYEFNFQACPTYFVWAYGPVRQA